MPASCLSPGPRPVEPALPPAVERPFVNAEEAWFWFMSWRLMVEDGGTPGYEGRDRPCTPFDMLACLRRLVKPGRLTRRHLQVLTGYGRRFEAPAHGPLARLWEEGMTGLEELLRAKGIVGGKVPA